MSTNLITVALCTWNRAPRLRVTLESMAALVVPPGLEWDVIVVDNASTDDTREVALSFADRLPLRCVHEPIAGLSNARNCAVREAAGAYIIFTDDDVLLDPDWLAAYARAFARWPDADIFGGPIEPFFEGTPPSWMAEALKQMGAVYGRQDLGDAPVRLQPENVGQGPYGANMAMRRSALGPAPFDPAFGVKHGQYRIGEETQLIRRMLEGGSEGWWSPEPKLRHVIPIEAQHVSYVRRWMVGAGRTDDRNDRANGGPPADTDGRLRWLMLKYELRYRLARLTAPPKTWIYYLAASSHIRGRLLNRRDLSSTRIAGHGEQ